MARPYAVVPAKAGHSATAAASSMTLSREIHRHAAFGDADPAVGSRRIAAAADEARHGVGDHGADSGDVAVTQRIQRIFLRAADARIENHDVGILAGLEEAAIQAVDHGIVARGG